MNRPLYYLGLVGVHKTKEETHSWQKEFRGNGEFWLFQMVKARDKVGWVRIVQGVTQSDLNFRKITQEAVGRMKWSR